MIDKEIYWPKRFQYYRSIPYLFNAYFFAWHATVAAHTMSAIAVR